MKTRTLLIPIAGILFAALAALPFAVYAQDVATDVPPTVESFPTVEQPPVTIEPTLAPTAIPEPSPIDETKIPTWLGVVAVVLVVGIVSIGIVGIQKAAGGLPEWSRELILAALNSGVASLDTYVEGTDTTIDDAAVAELKVLVTKLTEELRATKAQVSQNTQDIAVTNQAVARSQNVG